MQIMKVLNLCYSYKKTSSNNVIKRDFELKNINFEIYESEVLCILGPNGSGKSTLLKLLAKIYKPDSGNIIIEEKDIKFFSNKQYSNIVHYIPQNPFTSLDFSVVDTIVTGVNPKLGFFEFPSKKDYEKAKNLLKEFDCLHLKNKSLKQISGGELQLVFFLRSLMSNAKVLIFDEPTAFLDFKNQAKILDIIVKISGQKKTIVVSLHDPNHVLKISDRVMLLKNGGIQKIGKPEDVLSEKNLIELYEYPIKKLKSEEENEYFFKI